MKSIVLINCYFGKLTEHIEFYLESVKNNPTVNFLLVTDDKSNYNYPENVKVEYMEFTQLKDKMQSLFDFQIELSTPYKLCDYKPCFGKLFLDYVKDFDYWGYADIDLIFGDIRKFMTEEVLSFGYDKIQTAGHFTIMPVGEESVNFYTTKVDNYLYYKDVYSNSKNYAFDEWPGLASIYANLGKKIYNEVNDIADLSYKCYHFYPSEECYRRISCGKEWHSHNIVYLYESGKLWSVALNYKGEVTKKEMMYVHYQKRKLCTLGQASCERFLMVPPGKIVRDIPEITPKYLRKVANEHKLYMSYIKMRYKNFLKKLKK